MKNVSDKELNRLIQERVRRELKIQKYTYAEIAADKVASFGGSWAFIGVFSFFCFAWIVFNIWIDSFDPYPFVFLNLFLSCLAAIQAPIIMMSNNRKNQIDRARDDLIYKNSLKVDIEVNNLLEKLDELKNKTDSILEEWDNYKAN